jgi:MOSC domain-containing protein YiiM
MRPPILLSIQVGRPRDYGAAGAPDSMDRPWTTGFFKETAAGPVSLGRTNLHGDGQADLVNHGGADKAVCAYSADHYDAWRRELGRPDLPFGAFGENFTVRGLTEADVCIGDVWRLGEAVVQVSQPRQPCWKLARRWRITDLPDRVLRSGRTGWYFRVLTEGSVASGLPMTHVDRPFPRWTVERANRVMHRDTHDAALAAELASIPLLSSSWRSSLSSRRERDPASRGG